MNMAFLDDLASTSASPTEREKWDNYYAGLPLPEEDEQTRRFNDELVLAVSTFLKPGSHILEAGCGGGRQSLALARTKNYSVSLMDFSDNALDYARRLFEREQVPAEFHAGDVLAPGQPAYDLVFNAGVLEHYTPGEQAAFLRGMASRSRRFVLALAPNRQCYWYWLWRIRTAAAGDWPFGKEVPTDNLAAAFTAAGLTVVGRVFLGQAWTESFINSLAEAAPDLRDQILAVHRSPVIPPSQKSYLVAWLGLVPGVPAAGLPHWSLPGAAEETPLPEALAALSDALALRIGAEARLKQQQAEAIQLERTASDLRRQLALTEQAATLQSEQSASDLSRQLTLNQQAVQEAFDLRLQLTLSQRAVQDADQAADRAATELRAQLAVGHRINLNLEQEISDRASQLSLAQAQSADKDRSIGSLEEQLRAQARALADREAEAAGLRAEHLRWQSSRLWRFGGLYWQLRAGLKFVAYHVLPGSLLRRMLAWRWQSIASLLFTLLPRPVRAFYRAFRYHGYLEEDNGQVVVYCERDELFPHYPHRRSLSFGDRGAQVPVSLVVTVRNEQATARAWLDALQRQTKLPDEVIIVDGGSADGTLEQLQQFAQAAPFETKIIAAGNVNIARGKNIGIAQASHSTIVNTDFGCDLERTWLEYLVRPFELDETLEVVAGWYEASSTTATGKTAALELIPVLSQVHPQYFIPSTRSIAFRKSAWEQVAGYPEWLSLTGDDTYFGLELKRVCSRWAFVPEARVYWHAPDTIRLAILKAYRWSIGDGEAGMFAERYWQSLLRMARLMLAAAFVLASLALSPVFPWLLALPAVAVVAFAVYSRWLVRRQFPEGLSNGMLARWLAFLPFMQVARLAGFNAGVRGRPAAMRRRYASVTGTVFILSGVPFTDSGGGPRSTQLALEFLRRGFLVVFINKYPRDESVELHLNYTHPNLLTFAVQEFELDAIFQTYRPVLSGKDLLGIVEFPLPDFVPLIKRIRAEAGHVVYDLIDDWLSSLGALWYSRRTDQAIIELCDVLIATAAPLQRRLEGWSRRQVALLQNAVNPALFSRTRHYDRPEDLPDRDFVICYVGALWGEWFDWRLLQKIALAFPDAALAVIGDYRNQCPSPPPNLHFLGLKPQTALAAYLAYTTVATIPWKISPLTHATSPLKVYEYLAMGKPVVAPRLNALEGIPYVLLSNDEEEFIANIDRARRIVVDSDIVETFIQDNSWSERVDRLLELIRQATKS